MTSIAEPKKSGRKNDILTRLSWKIHNSIRHSLRDLCKIREPREGRDWAVRRERGREYYINVEDDILSHIYVAYEWNENDRSRFYIVVWAKAASRGDANCFRKYLKDNNFQDNANYPDWYWSYTAEKTSYADRDLYDKRTFDCAAEEGAKALEQLFRKLREQVVRFEPS